MELGVRPGSMTFGVGGMLGYLELGGLVRYGWKRDMIEQRWIERSDLVSGLMAECCLEENAGTMAMLAEERKQASCH